MQLVHVDNMNKYEKDVILTVFQAKTCFKKISCMSPHLLASNEIRLDYTVKLTHK